jgi:IS605 OrfB family transposase
MASRAEPPDKRKRSRDVVVDDGGTKRTKRQQYTHATWWTDRSTAISKHALPVPRGLTSATGRTSWLKRDELARGDDVRPDVTLQRKSVVSAQKVATNVARRSKKVMPSDCVIRTWKIRLAPTTEFKQRAQRWFSISRLTRRFALAILKHRNPTGFKTTPDWKKVKNWLTPCKCLDVQAGVRCSKHPFEHHPERHYIYNEPNPDPTKKRWVRLRPGGPLVEDHKYCTRAMKNATIHQMCSSIGEAIELLKTRGASAGEFDFKHQTQQDRYQSVCIESVDGSAPAITWDANGFSWTPTYNPGSVRAKSKRDMRKLHAIFTQQNADHPFKNPLPVGTVGCRFPVTLKYDRVHRSYTLCIPYWKKKHTFEPIADASTRSTRKLAVALDPGVRTFQATYDSGGASIKYGHGDVVRMSQIAEKMDKLRSVWSYDQNRMSDDGHRPAPTHSERKRAKRAFNRMSAKIENLKTDAHWKLAAELCQSYEHVMIPVFKVAQMVKRSGGGHRRKLSKRTVREMHLWSHYEFRQRLKHKAEELGTHVHEVGEEYTTVGCGECGRINEVGSGTWYRCAYCMYECDRDRGAARTIYIKNIETYVGVYDMPMD